MLILLTYEEASSEPLFLYHFPLDFNPLGSIIREGAVTRSR